LSIGDFILGGDSGWYEVITLTDATHATLYQIYPGTTQSGVSSQKLGVTSTGAAASSSTAVQTVSVSGTSLASRLTISGGWDLSSQTQTGITFFRQLHGTFANRYGRGLYFSSKSYVSISNIGFLRYDTGIYYSSSNNNTATSCTCNSNSNYGIYYYSSSNNNTATSCTCNSNGIGIYYSSSNNNTATSCTCNSNITGIYYSSSNNNTATSCTCNSNSNYGIYYYYSSNNNTATSCTCNSNSNYGIYYYYYSNNNTASSCTCNSNTTNSIYSDTSLFNVINNTALSNAIAVATAKTYSDKPCLQFQKYNTAAGDHRCYYEYGNTVRDVTTPRTGTECLKYNPSSAIYYISQSFFFKADSGVQQTLSAYIRKTSTFNGDVQLAIFFEGIAIADWAAVTPTNNDTYEQKSAVAAAGSITEDGVLELRIKVRGSAGSIYVDDLATG
jgi:parallel beta-helix repeat protein